MKNKLSKLSDPMPSIKWRVQSIKETQKGLKAICIPYVDARDVQDRLDDVCGIQNWQSRHKEVKGNLFCEIGILIDDVWVWKSDVGAESNIEKAKGESSDSFKRAAVMWGIGRDLYKSDPMVINATKYKGKAKPCNKSGQVFWDGTALSNYINEIIQERNARQSA